MGIKGKVIKLAQILTGPKANIGDRSRRGGNYRKSFMKEIRFISRTHGHKAYLEAQLLDGKFWTESACEEIFTTIPEFNWGWYYISDWLLFEASLHSVQIHGTIFYRNVHFPNDDDWLTVKKTLMDLMSWHFAKTNWLLKPEARQWRLHNIDHQSTDWSDFSPKDWSTHCESWLIAPWQTESSQLHNWE